MAVMIDIADFYPLVQAKAPAAPIPEVENAIREAARMLCRRLKLWREEESFVITEPEAEAIYAAQDARIDRIEAARFNGVPITFKTPEELDREFPGWQDADDGTPQAVTQMQPNVLTLYPKGTGTLRVRLGLVPSLDCATLPDFLLNDYADILRDGAAGNILAKSTNPDYSSPQLGTALIQKFMGDIDTRDASAARPQIRAALRARSRFF